MTFGEYLDKKKGYMYKTQTEAWWNGYYVLHANNVSDKSPYPKFEMIHQAYSEKGGK